MPTVVVYNLPMDWQGLRIGEGRAKNSQEEIHCRDILRFGTKEQYRQVDSRPLRSQWG